MPGATNWSERFVLVTLSLCALWVGPIRARGLPQATPNAKACTYLPVAELEKHFGTKAQNVRGVDLSTRNTCNGNFPDPFHTVAIESHPSLAADLAMTAAQH